MTAADPMLPRLARVWRRRRDGPAVWTLELEEEGADGPAFAPGQFTMLTAFGVGEVPVSISGDPAKPRRLVQTIRAVGAVTEALVRLAPGAQLGLRGPFGSAWPDAAAGGDVLVVAGGLGLAPLRPLLYRLLGARDSYRRVTLLYGSRGPEEVLFRRELEAWQAKGAIDVAVTVDHAPAGWSGHVGVVPALVPQARFDPARTTAFVCGPEVMMRFAIAALLEAGLAAGSIHLSMERNMKCAVGLCGHCQFGGSLVCRDGPVYRYDRIADLLGVKEL